MAWNRVMVFGEPRRNATCSSRSTGGRARGARRSQTAATRQRPPPIGRGERIVAILRKFLVGRIGQALRPLGAVVDESGDPLVFYAGAATWDTGLTSAALAKVCASSVLTDQTAVDVEGGTTLAVDAVPRAVRSFGHRPRDIARVTAGAAVRIVGQEVRAPAGEIGRGGLAVFCGDIVAAVPRTAQRRRSAASPEEQQNGCDRLESGHGWMSR